jgi:vacuolar-type H+-ATPase subunit H
MEMEDQGLEDPQILKKIQEVETEVERMTEKATADARHRVQQAREQADPLLLNAQTELARMREAELQEGVTAAEREASEMIQKARSEAQELKEKNLARMEAAADLVLKRVLGKLMGGESV